MSDIVDQILSLNADCKIGEVIPLGLTKLEMRANILALQTRMEIAQKSGEVAHCNIDEAFPLKHYFAPGAYAREMTLPAGHWIIGKIHKHAHLNFISRGRVAVLTEEGVMFLSGHHTFVSSPGTKRLVLVLEETVWTTVHLTEKVVMQEIEDEIIAKSYEELNQLERDPVRELI